MLVHDAISRTFDFVIVGGGTAGLVVATRLTEDPAVNVLVLEAGKERLNDPKILIPALFSQLYEDPDYDWSFKSTPQRALNGRITAQPRGKVLGGSSAINFLMSGHATASDVDAWEKLGNPGWNWASLLPYYQKSETFNKPTPEQTAALGGEIYDPSKYGTDGPVQLTMPWGTGEVDTAWRPTWQTLGLGAEADPRSPGGLGGYALLKYTDTAGRRSYAANAYYAPNAGRSNLAVLTGANVSKLLLETSEPTGSATAKGVLFTVEEGEFTVVPSREVILCAGSFQTPKLLELSGVGSSEILEQHGIKVVVDNPNVGENLQDHCLVPLNIEACPGVMSAESLRQREVLEWAVGEWQAGRGGPLATGINGTAFLSFQSVAKHIGVSPTLLQDLASNGDDAQLSLQRNLLANEQIADLQVNWAPVGVSPYTGDNLSSWWKHTDPGTYLGIAVATVNPFARGSVHITSSDAQVHPAIDPNYLNHPVDFEALVQGILLAQKIFETEPLAKYGVDREDGSGKKIQNSFDIPGRIDRATAEKLVKEATIPSWHPSSTCAMLPRERKGVVDTQLKVYGVDRLRIVDASVMPLLVRGNICSAVYAIAEKASDIIKEEYNLGTLQANLA